MNYNDLVEIAKSKKIMIKEICEQISMTRQGLQSALDNDTIELRKLKLLCNVLQITPSLFFDKGSFLLQINASGNFQSGNGNKMILESKDKEIDYLKQSIKDKDKIIELLTNRSDISHGYSFASEPNV